MRCIDPFYEASALEPEGTYAHMPALSRKGKEDPSQLGTHFVQSQRRLKTFLELDRSAVLLRLLRLLLLPQALILRLDWDRSWEVLLRHLVLQVHLAMGG